MQVVFFDGVGRQELDLRVNNPVATVADLVAALDPGGAGERSLLIGDRMADPNCELSEVGLHIGSILRLAPKPSALDEDGVPAPMPTDRELVVVNGLDAGRRFSLTPGEAVIGRAPGCDVVLRHGSIARRHAELSVSAAGRITISRLESGDGMSAAHPTEPEVLDDEARVRLGDLELEVRGVYDADRVNAVDPLRHLTTAGAVPFNRPPRPALSSVPEGIVPPLAPSTTKSRLPLFAGRRQGETIARGERERFRRELQQFSQKLSERAQVERRRRRTALPDPAEILRRVELPTTALWERRPPHPDFLQLRLGVGDLPWTPRAADRGRSAEVPVELAAALKKAALLQDAPVPVELAGGGVVGIVGDRPAALALARSLVCQAAVLHGPADLPVMILTAAEAKASWDWAKWLPHTLDASGSGRMLADDLELSTRMVESRLKQAGSSDQLASGIGRPRAPTLLVVVDDVRLIEGRKAAPARSLLRGEAIPVAGIVIAPLAEQLPAVCTTVIDMTDPSGLANLNLPQQGQRIEEFLACGMADDTARECARLLARFEDPELDIVGAGLPETIRLLPLLDLEECSAEAILARWKAGGVNPPPAAPIGVAEDGVFSIDFVADGPHCLIGGTTGAGKSELLRSMVAGLAASVDPDHLNFVLIDFKGGSAFDECAKLPHTVGMVTDLDEHLAERALRSFEAELKHRERVLRAAKATDLPDYLRINGGAEPLPRLLIVIDEFATLKAELPGFIDALVRGARRGRSLGVHMLLATQRPQGAISDNIKANTNLRIALRMQDKTDSSDVIDVPEAATIPRTAPGRAYVRLGPGEVVAIQTALVTGLRHEVAPAPVEVAPFVYGAAPRQIRTTPEVGRRSRTDEDTDLSVLVSAINTAFAATERRQPRRPWPDPLPDDVGLDELIDSAEEAEPSQRPRFVPLALADDPEKQTQYPMGWVPADGNLIVYGVGGSGSTTALSSLALSLARLNSPDDMHLYILDLGAGELEALALLPHVGAVVQVGERERQTRLIRYLRTELDRRQQLSETFTRELPTIVLLVDGWRALAAEYDDIAGGPILEAFSRVFGDGPGVDIFTVITSDRATSIPARFVSLVHQRLALRLGDKSDYAEFGVRSSAVPQMVPGRAIVGLTGQVIQIARPVDGVSAAAERLVARSPAQSRPPRPIETLATRVALADVGRLAQLDDRPWILPVAIAEKNFEAASLIAYEGEHVLIAGPARSGKSSALLTVAEVCCRARPDLKVVAVATSRSPLASHHLIDECLPTSAIEEVLGPLLDDAVGPVLVLIDDAHLVEDAGGVLERLSTSNRPDLLLVAAGRNDDLRAGYSHWTRPLRRSKLGLLLRPNVDMDGDVLGTQLPRRAPVPMAAGRGYLVNSGEAELVQVAFPTDAPRSTVYPSNS